MKRENRLHHPAARRAAGWLRQGGQERQANTLNLPFKLIKEAVLGKKYELSLVFAAPRLSAQLNKKYRRKRGPADILSFCLSKTAGEIFIDLKTAKKKAALWGEPPRLFAARLLIHGLLHLKGYRHGSKMEREERKFRERFKLKLRS